MHIRIYFFHLLLVSAYSGICQSSKIIQNDLYAPTKSEKAKNYYNTAHAAMENRNYRKAIDYYKLAIAEDPGYIDAYDNVGLTYRQLDMLDSAAWYDLASIKKYPKGTIARRNLAVVEEKRGNLDKAEACYKQAKEIDSKDPETYYGLMRVCAMEKKYDEALESGKFAEKYYSERNDPNIGDCYAMLCAIYFMKNNKEKAKQYALLAQNKGVELPQAITDALK